MSRPGAQDARGAAMQEPHRGARSGSGDEPSSAVAAAHTDRDLEDASAVIAVITALAANTAAPQTESSRTMWGSPAHRLGALGPGTHTWWTSGAAR